MGREEIYTPLKRDRNDAAPQAVLREELGAGLPRDGQAALQRKLDAARRAVDEYARAAAWAQRLAKAGEKAVAYEPEFGAAEAPSQVAPSDALPPSSPPERRVVQASWRAHVQLTVREWEVAVLVTRGFTNRQIGAALVIAERTVDTHVAHVLAKLGVHTRVRIAAWVMDQGWTSG